MLHHIRTTNTVSARLLHQLRILNDETNVYLQTATLAADVTPGSIEDIFQDFYYAAGVENAKLALVPEISLAKLRKYQAAASSATVTTDAQRALVALIDKYTVLLATHHLANSIICKTILCKNHLGFWSDLKLSTTAKATYGVQTLPVRIYKFVKAGIQNAVVSRLELGTTRVFSSLAQSFRQLAGEFPSHFNANFIVRSSKLRLVKVPLSFIDDEIRHKIDVVSAQLDVQYQKLGLLLNNLPVEAELIPKLVASEPSVDSMLVAIEKYTKDDSEYRETAPPGLLVRYWPLLLLLLRYGPSTSRSAWENRHEMVDWVRFNLVDTTLGFWKNWIVKPVEDMLAILRDDGTMTITSKESLRSDLDSLERMVTDFMNDNNMPVSPQLVHSSVAQGDLTMMMSQYESEIRTPYKLIVTGLLVRSILIQIQKTKVDGSLVINGIDKLLKSQQLLFGVLSILPSLFILWQGQKALTKDPSLTQSMASRRIDCLKSLNHIGELVNHETADDKLVLDGKLFVEIVNLVLLSRDIVPRKLRSEWMRDLNELTVASTDNYERASRIVDRVWNMYSPFFRM